MPAKKLKIAAGTTLPKQLSYIGGAYVRNQSGATFVTRHPGNDQPICEVEIAGEPEVNAAVAAARAAYQGWSTTRAVERGNILRRAAKLVRERNDELAALETLDTGKPIAETSVVDIATGADVMENGKQKEVDLETAMMHYRDQLDSGAAVIASGDAEGQSVGSYFRQFGVTGDGDGSMNGRITIEPSADLRKWLSINGYGSAFDGNSQGQPHVGADGRNSGS
jgi:hypothetical protein